MKSDQAFADSLIRVVNQNHTNPNFDVVSMAVAMKTSDCQLQRRLKAQIGQSPMQYLRQFRLEKSLRYLRDGVPVGEAAQAVGFSSHAYFTSCFRLRFGVTPSQMQLSQQSATLTE